MAKTANEQSDGNVLRQALAACLLDIGYVVR